MFSYVVYVICSVIYCCVNLDVIKLSLDVGNLVIRRQAQVDRELTECHAMVTLGNFVSLDFVAIILEPFSVARFGNIHII